jgi:hypothetical protein
MTALNLLPPAQRLTIVTHIGSAGDGDSLRGQNVNAFPEGALFYVQQSNRFYSLRKNIDSAIGPQNGLNVVDGVGSSPENGRFVAVQQFAEVQLSSGTAVATGFDLSADGRFLVSYTNLSGTPGFIHAAKTAANVVTVSSSSSADNSRVLVVFVEAPASS